VNFSAVYVGFVMDTVALRQVFHLVHRGSSVFPLYKKSIFIHSTFWHKSGPIRSRMYTETYCPLITRKKKENIISQRRGGRNRLILAASV